MAAGLAALAAAGWVVCLHLGDRQPPSVEPPVAAGEPVGPPQPKGNAPAPGPVAALPASEATTNEPRGTNLYARFARGDILRVDRERLEPFLTRNRRSVEALLGGLRASGDDELLKEAKDRFPNDPRVQFAAAFKTDSPEERQQWLEAMKRSAPENAMANYLIAAEQLKSGHPEAALQELAAATAKPGFENYLLDFVQNAEEAYHAAGYGEAEAKAIAMPSALLPELAPLKQLAVDMVDLAKRYQQAGDGDAAAGLQSMALNLGQRLAQPQVTLIQELVGVAIQRIVLNSMNAEGPYDNTGRTVQNQMEAVLADKTALQVLFKQAEPGLMSLSDQDLAHFFDRMKLYGEVGAMRWVVNQNPPQSP